MSTEHTKFVTQVKDFQERAVKADVWHCCLNCVEWREVAPNPPKCLRFHVVPPPDVLVVGCVKWEPDIPF